MKTVYAPDVHQMRAENVRLRGLLREVGEWLRHGDTDEHWRAKVAASFTDRIDDLLGECARRPAVRVEDEDDAA